MRDVSGSRLANALRALTRPSAALPASLKRVAFLAFAAAMLASAFIIYLDWGAVRSIYVSLLGREPSLHEHLENLVFRRRVLASRLVRSRESLRQEVSDTFREYLDREPDVSGFGYWTDFLTQLKDEELVRAKFVLSPEFHVRWGAGSHREWVHALYGVVLRRRPDQIPREHLDQYVTAIESGASRDAVAEAFIQSDERRCLWMTDRYFALTGKALAETRIRRWVAAMRRGASQRDILAAMLTIERTRRQSALAPFSAAPARDAVHTDTPQTSDRSMVGPEPHPFCRSVSVGSAESGRIIAIAQLKSRYPRFRPAIGWSALPDGERVAVFTANEGTSIALDGRCRRLSVFEGGREASLRVTGRIDGANGPCSYLFGRFPGIGTGWLVSDQSNGGLMAVDARNGAVTPIVGAVAPPDTYQRLFLLDVDRDGYDELLLIGDETSGEGAVVSLAAAPRSAELVARVTELRLDAPIVRPIGTVKGPAEPHTRIAFADRAGAIRLVLQENGAWRSTQRVEAPWPRRTGCGDVQWGGAGDVDGDGSDEIIGYDPCDGTVRVVRPSENASPAAVWAHAAGEPPGSGTFLVSDLDGDTRPDFILTRGGLLPGVVGIGDGAGRYLLSDLDPIWSSDRWSHHELRDVDGDGDRDLSVWTEDGQALIGFSSVIERLADATILAGRDAVERTSELGVAEIRGLSRGAHELSAQMSGYRFAPETVSLEIGSNMTTVRFEAALPRYDARRDLARSSFAPSICHGIDGRPPAAPRERVSCSDDGGFIASGTTTDGASLVCCPLPARDLLERERVTAEGRCPDGHIVTGIEKSYADGRVMLQCARINEARYALDVPTPGTSWDFVTGLSRLRRSDLPAAIRDGVGRLSHRQWAQEGCLGDPVGSLLTSVPSATCSEALFAQVRWRGNDGDPAAGTKVSLFEDCREISDRFSPRPQCIR